MCVNHGVNEVDTQPQGVNANVVSNDSVDSQNVSDDYSKKCVTANGCKQNVVADYCNKHDVDDSAAPKADADLDKDFENVVVAGSFQVLVLLLYLFLYWVTWPDLTCVYACVCVCARALSVRT